MKTTRLIAIDPGIIVTGFCILDFYKTKSKLVAYGAIKPPNKDRLERRLMYLYDEVLKVISKFNPSIMVLEDSFYSKNVKSAVMLGQARSVIMLSGAKSKADIYEFAPRKIKQSICGNGSATKKQVQYMVTQILNLKDVPKPIDITDAMAVGLCFINNFKVI
tara:strand:+ start:519 stop:1004 length:486 start_codon:yes stop_codon:yes gene_type:complete